jgi:hypothetical protein
VRQLSLAVYEAGGWDRGGSGEGDELTNVLSIQVLECTATDLPLELHKLSRKGPCRSTAISTPQVRVLVREQLFQASSMRLHQDQQYTLQ